MPMQNYTILSNTLFEWNEEKNHWLAQNRGITFEDIVTAVKSGKLLYQGRHHNKCKYEHQYIVVVEVNEYAFFVPFVWQENNKAFLKTIIPSRKMTKRYL